MTDRIAHAGLRSKVMTAEEAAGFIKHGDMIGFAGFTGAGYPKVVPPALAERIKEAHARGDEFKVKVLTGASTAPELDGALAEVDGVEWRMPYQSDGHMRNRINAGDANYNDMHLSHSGPQIEQGFYGKVDFAIVEVTRITDTGTLVFASSVGNNVSYLNAAEKIIIEVNSWQSLDLEGMHDIYSVGLPPHRQPISITAPGDRIGTTDCPIDIDKVVAVVETNSPDRNSAFKPVDEDSAKIAGYLLDFLDNEVKQGRLPENLLPMQSGVGNIPNAVLAGLAKSKYENLTSYTEVIQDGMIDLMDAGKMSVASATAFSLSPEYAERMNENAKDYRDKIVLRPQDISNHPGVVRRLGLITTNGMIEADIYGNVNSTHVAGSRMMNGIGGSGDFTRNAYISTFVSPSIAKGGAISAIVPMVSHQDHSEHDVMVIITEQGLADLRGLSPRKRARVVIENCAHPMYKEALLEYVERAEKATPFKHTPHDLGTSFDFHRRFLENGSMLPK
ncbi:MULTISPECIES: acetyl-CoA hydrolase/transferase family protein [unclassified Corynebacterium]|uniref:acetyl-CoA hydrolase/transferase family protein n=1 Tax=unclassified Corynebacterium TaxID=2624378 RepID=UPI0030A9870E